MSMRQVGQVCWRWNQERRQEAWKMWPQGSFLAPEKGKDVFCHLYPSVPSLCHSSFIFSLVHHSFTYMEILLSLTTDTTYSKSSLSHILQHLHLHLNSLSLPPPTPPTTNHQQPVPVTISSRQMMHTLSTAVSSSGVALG